MNNPDKSNGKAKAIDSDESFFRLIFPSDEFPDEDEVKSISSKHKLR